MTGLSIGFLHPGTIGVTLAETAQNSGHSAFWVSEGRSQATRTRAETRHLTDAETLGALCATCQVIVSICPPNAAEDVAAGVLAHGFRGLYLDANAISPARTLRIAEMMANAGATFVDGSIIGGPAREAGKTWLYLAGAQAASVQRCFSAGPLETAVVSEVTGRAAALKMCFAAYTKGTTALMAAILATAEATGVREALEAQWSRGDGSFPEQVHHRVCAATGKAWRFEGEMDEIATTFRDAGMPDGFHKAAADVYARLASFKRAASTPSLAEVLEALLGTS
jgi:3-hydroxyisobutyrate dehydrogenase-like beta-hydroxyacid dehydrogenase